METERLGSQLAHMHAPWLDPSDCHQCIVTASTSPVQSALQGQQRLWWWPEVHAAQGPQAHSQVAATEHLSP